MSEFDELPIDVRERLNHLEVRNPRNYTEAAVPFLGDRTIGEALEDDGGRAEVDNYLTRLEGILGTTRVAIDGIPLPPPTGLPTGD